MTEVTFYKYAILIYTCTDLIALWNNGHGLPNITKHRI